MGTDREPSVYAMTHVKNVVFVALGNANERSLKKTIVKTEKNCQEPHYCPKHALTNLPGGSTYFGRNFVKTLNLFIILSCTHLY